MYRVSQQRGLKRAASSTPTVPAGSSASHVLTAEQIAARDHVVLAAVLDPVVAIDARGTILSTSDSIYRVFGWRSMELVGQNVSVLMPEPHRSAHSGYLERYARSGVTNIMGRPRKFQAQHKDGSVFPIELSVSRADMPGERSPIFVGNIRDMSKKVAAERLIEHQADVLRVALASANAGAWLWNVRTGDVECTPEQLALYGFDPAQSAPKYDVWIERMHPDDRLYVRNYKWPVKGTARLGPQCEFRVLHPTKGTRWMLGLGVATLDEKDRLSQVSGINIDVTERKQTEQELAEHRERLEHLVEQRTEELRRTHEQMRVADRMASIGALAAGLGHDMNNMLLPARAHLNEVTTCTKARVQRSVKKVRSALDYLQQLADGLHYLVSDPDRENGGGLGEPTNLHRWWRQTGSLLSKPVPEHVSVEVVLPKTIPDVTIAPHRLTQAVLNLIANAGQAIPAPAAGKAGGVRTGRVIVSAKLLRSDPPSVRLSVQDNGSGMTDEVRRRAFELFFTTKPRGLGTGLGLALVRKVVEDARGRVKVGSRVGKGTTVSLYLPVVCSPGGRARSNAKRRAVIAISDRRTSSLIRDLLESASVGVRADTRVKAEQLCVVDPLTTSIRVVEQWRKRVPRGVLVLVARAGVKDMKAWASFDPILMDNPDDFSCVRSAVVRAVERVF